MTHSTSETMMTCFFTDGFIFFKSYLEKQFRIHNHHFYERKKNVAVIYFLGISL